MWPLVSTRPSILCCPLQEAVHSSQLVPDAGRQADSHPQSIVCLWIQKSLVHPSDLYMCNDIHCSHVDFLYPSGSLAYWICDFFCSVLFSFLRLWCIFPNFQCGSLLRLFWIFFSYCIFVSYISTSFFLQSMEVVLDGIYSYRKMNPFSEWIWQFLDCTCRWCTVFSFLVDILT